MRWWIGTAVVLASNTWLTLSDAVVGLMKRDREDRSEARLAQWLIDLIQRRPDFGDAEIHALMWATAALLVVLAVRVRPRIYVASAVVWVWSIFVEILQPVVSSLRTFQWIDLLGNTIGVVLGLLIGQGILSRRDTKVASEAKADHGPVGGAV
jgi:lysylphosphatidylglycerol synthetase-like protein (DUF2156 family)